MRTPWVDSLVFRVVSAAVALSVTFTMAVGLISAPSASASGLTYDVTQSPYNANTSGTVNDRAAIQQAIDDANAAGGGTVLLPSGASDAARNVFLTGGLVLKSNVTLKIGKWATLKQSGATGDYTTTVGLGKVVDTSFMWNYWFYKNRPLVFSPIGTANVAIVGESKTNPGRISMTYGSDDAHTIWMKAVGFVGVTNAKVEYIDFKGMNSVSIGMYNVSGGLLKDSTFREPNTLNSGPLELSDSQHIQVTGNTATGMNDDAILLEVLSGNPQCGTGQWCEGAVPQPMEDVQIDNNDIDVARSGSALAFYPWGNEDPTIHMSDIRVLDNNFTAASNGSAIGCFWCGNNPYQPATGVSVNSEGQSPMWNWTMSGNTYSGDVSTFDRLIIRDLTLDPSDGLSYATRPRNMANRGFEAGTLSAWSTLAQPTQISVASVSGQTGSWAARIDHYNLGYAALWQGLKTDVGKSYTFRIAAKTSGTNARMLVQNGCTGATLASTTFSNTSWASKSVTFTGPTCENVWLVIDTNSSASSSAWVAIDDAVLLGNYVDSEDEGITYSANWGYVREGDRRNLGYYQPYSSASAASVTIPFEGTKATVQAGKGPQGGHAKVYVDGVLQTTIDLYNPTDVWSADVWTSGTLSAGAHTIELEKTGTGRDLYFDAVRIGS